MNNEINAMTIAAPRDDNADAWNLLPVHHFTRDMDGNELLDYFRTNGAFGKVCAAICRRRGLDTELVEIEWYKDENGAKVEAEGLTVNAYPVWVMMAVLMQYEERAAAHYAEAIARLWAAPAEVQAEAKAVCNVPAEEDVVPRVAKYLKGMKTAERNAAMRNIFENHGVTLEQLVLATGLKLSTIRRIVITK